MLQICVAMVQDLNFSKNSQDSKRRLIMGAGGSDLFTTRLLAEKRAFLGTFYLTAW